jgi:predicted GH43/DUF377 family glycosyl hydrolase
VGLGVKDPRILTMEKRGVLRYTLRLSLHPMKESLVTSEWEAGWVAGSVCVHS